MSVSVKMTAVCSNDVAQSGKYRLMHANHAATKIVTRYEI